VSDTPLFVAFDLETTGLFAGVDRIVEFAAVVFGPDGVVDAVQRLADPGMPISADASRVSGITDDMVRGAPPVADLLPDLLAFLARGTPVAHNAPFDAGFLRAALQDAGLPGPAVPILDTRGLARQAFPGRRSYSLENLVRDLHLRTDGAHRALADAHACRLLFGACVAGLEAAAGRVPGSLSVEELAALSGPPLDLGPHAPRGPGIAALLDGALRRGGSVDIRYRSAREECTDRRIRPIAFTLVGGSPAVRAFCALRGEERIFRLDSIVEARPAAEGPAR
jgi:DNA polymerase III subunit epsilon